MKLAEIITDAKTGEVTFVLTNTMTCQNDNCNMPAYDYRDIIGTYCLEIMVALKKRMDNCLNTMLNPKNTILTASDLQVVFKKESGIDVTKDALALQRLDEAAERAKIELSTTTETEINIPFITSTDAGPQHLLLKMTRAKLEELASEFITRSLEIARRAVEASPFKKEEINQIIMAPIS